MGKRFLKFYRSSFSGLPRSVWILCLAVLINRSGSIVLFFMTLYLKNELGFTVTEAGRMISLYGIGSLFGAYLGGYLSDRIGHRVVQVGSLVLSGLGFIFLSFLTSSAAIGLTLFLVALLGEAFRPAASTGLAEFCPPDLRTRGFALLRLAVNLGLGIGPAIGGFLASIEYHLVFWADGVTCLIAAAFLAVFFTRYRKTEIASKTMEPVAVSPWRDRIFLFLLLLIFASGLIFVQLFNTWPIYLQESFGLFEHNIGMLLALNAVLIVLFEMPIIHLIEKRDHLAVMAAGSVLLGLGFAMLPLGSGLFFAGFTVVIWTLGEILTIPLVVAFIANRSSDRNRGKYMGLFNFSFALSFVIAPLGGTWIFDRWNGNMLWAACGFLGLLMSAGYLFVKQWMPVPSRLNESTDSSSP